MRETQKVIKYGAIAFAIFLIVSIFSSIYYVGFELGSVILNVSSDKENFDIKVFNDDVAILNVDIDCSKLVIKIGESLKVETNNKYIDIKQDSNKLSLIEKKRKLFEFSNNNEVTIYFPKTLTFDKVVIDNGAGSIDIEALLTKELDLEIGAGKVNIDSLKVSEKTSIESGAGEVIITEAELNNLELDQGVGKFTLNATLKGSNEIEAGIGELLLTLLDSKDNYQIKASKGIGSISIDDETQKNNTTFGNGINTISIDGGIGRISINFK